LNLESQINAVDAGSAGAGHSGGAPLRPIRRSRQGAPLSWRESIGAAGLAKFLVLAALVTWLYEEQLYRMFVLWQKPDWSHGFLMPLFCLWMLHTRKKELLLGDHPGSLWGLVLSASAIVIYVAAIFMQIGYPQALSVIVLILGLVLLLRGWRTLRYSLFPISFMMLAIPPPERLYRAFTQPLQQFAASIATFVLRTFPGAEIEQAGINIAYYMRGGVSGAFTVAGACSGMRSLLAFVSLGLAMAYFAPRPAWHRVAMALFVVPVALFCNVVRVIVTGAFQMYDYGNLASGTPHTVLGLLMFGLGFAIYMAILWGLDHLFIEAEDEPPLPLGGHTATGGAH
jgi:exosortase